MAGRIPQNFIDDLLDRIDIVEVIDRRVSLKKSGRNFTACCPFHDEKTPSFSVSQEKQFYYCFGCGAGGNAIGFLMDYDRIDFPRAVEVLADAAGLAVPREASAFEEPPRQKQNIYSILTRAADYYKDQLRNHPQKQRAIDYLKKRGLSGEIARDFDIGYAPPGWDNLLKALAQTDEERQLLLDSGMLIAKEEDGKLYDRFRDRIMFPIRDNRGRVIAFGGRVLGDDKPKYLNSPETPVFHKGRELYGLFQARKRSRKLERLMVVEGYMDVVALAQHQINWAVATLGTATSTDHLKQIFRLCPEVVFCFDGDDAGRKAAARALEAALPVMEDGRQARFLFLPQGEDPDSLVRRIGANDFQMLVNQSQPLENYLFDSQSEGLDLQTQGGRARLSKQASPLIQQLPNGIFKALMLEELAARTGLSRQRLEEIGQQMNADHTGGQPARQEQPPAGTELPAPIKRRVLDKPRSDATRDPVLYAITLMLHFPGSRQQIEVPDQLSDVEHSQLPLLLAMLELLKKRPDSTPAMLIGHWYGEPWGKTLTQLLQLEPLIPIEGNIGHELADTLKLIVRSHHHQLLDLEVDKLAATNYADLSPQQKQQLRLALNKKHGKS